MIINNKCVNFVLYKHSNPGPRYRGHHGLYMYKNNEWYFVSSTHYWVNHKRNPSVIQNAIDGGIVQCNLSYGKEYLEYWGSPITDPNKLPFYNDNKQ